jgi:hypothetical protein
VVVHGNGFLANVKMFDVCPSGCRLITPQSLTPGDTIQLEIAPERGGSVTVQQAVVQWVDGTEVMAHIVQIHPEDARKLDEVAWSSIPGELTLFHWLRTVFWGHTLQHVYLSYAPLSFGQSARWSEAA